MRSTLINPAEASAVALRRTAAFNLSSCVALSDPDPSVRNWTPVLVRKHAARSVPVHTVLCNRSGRKVTKTPQATRSAGGGIGIHFHVCLSLISGSSLGLSAHVLDTQGTGSEDSSGTGRMAGNRRGILDMGVAMDGHVNRMTREERSPSG